MEEDICGIYMIKNKANGKIYIGQSIHIYRRFVEHKCDLENHHAHNKHLQRSWDKYGRDSFIFSVVEECDKSCLDEREIFWISFYDAQNNGYNQTAGGGGVKNYVPTEETCRKISQGLKGKKKSAEHVQKMREFMKKYAKEHTNPNSIAVVCLNTGKEYVNSRAAARDLNLSRATASHIRDCCKHLLLSAGKTPDGQCYVWRNKEEYLTMSQSDVAETIEYAQKTGKLGRNGRALAVKCITTNECFPSIAEASAAYNANAFNIGACCRGKRKHAGKHPETHEKLSWEYA